MSEIDDLPPLRDIIAAHDLRARKALGQNFLLDLNLTDKIARGAGPLGGLTVFEIGPGPGGLTRSLLNAGAEKVIAIEFDPRAVAALQSLRAAAGGRLEIIHGDALQVDLVTLAPDAKRAIVANLPYNIATPLLTGWLQVLRENPDAFAHMTLMFQKEVAERITAEPGGKTYGRLSIIAQWLCAPHAVFDLPPSAFTPPPKVTSTVVHFRPRPPAPDWPAFASVEKLTAAAFGQRRKMIRSSLKNHAARLERLGIDQTLRAENLTVSEFIALASLQGLP